MHDVMRLEAGNRYPVSVKWDIKTGPTTWTSNDPGAAAVAVAVPPGAPPGAVPPGVSPVALPAQSRLTIKSEAGGPFADGVTVTGGTSKATGVVVSDNGSTLILSGVVGVFVADETIAAGLTTAIVVSFTPAQTPVVPAPRPAGAPVPAPAEPDTTKAIVTVPPSQSPALVGCEIRASAMASDPEYQGQMLHAVFSVVISPPFGGDIVIGDALPPEEPEAPTSKHHNRNNKK